MAPRKRPAARGAGDVAEIPWEQPPSSPTWSLPAESQVKHPEWALDMVRVLKSAGFLKHGNILNLQLWADCAGYCSELFAWKDLQKALQTAGYEVNVYLFCACDRDMIAENIILRNHQPKHFTRDITSRNFEAGTF